MKEFGYILDDDRNPVMVDMMTYLRWWAKLKDCTHKGPAIVGKTTVGDTSISTVFLPVMRKGTPLFETMAWGRRSCRRTYNTWEEAEAGHEEVVLSYKVEIQ